MNAGEKNGTHQVARSRSPNYPHFTLRECVGLLQQYANKNGVAEAHRDTALKFMGRSATSSTSNRLIASMQHYALFDVRKVADNRFFTPSKLAKEILGSTSENLKPALRKAALQPEAMQIIFDKWGENIPARQAIEKSLLYEFKFSNEGSEQFAGVIVDNYQYAGLTNGGNIDMGQAVLLSEPQVIDEPKTEVVKMTSQNGSEAQQEKPEILSVPKDLKAYRIPVDDERDAILHLPMGMVGEDYDYVADFVMMLKKKKAPKELEYEQ